MLLRNKVTLGSFKNTRTKRFLEKWIVMQKSISLASVQTHKHFQDVKKKFLLDEERSAKLHMPASLLNNLGLPASAKLEAREPIENSVQTRDVYNICTMHRGIDQIHF